MKKLKMFGVSLVALFAGMVGASALEFGEQGTADGKITYTKEADETFAYQVVRISKAQFDTVSSDIEALIEPLIEQTNVVEASTADYEAKEKAYNEAAAAYEKDASEANKTALDEAEAAMNEAKAKMLKDVEPLVATMNKVNDYVKQVAPYDLAKFTDVTDNALSGEITLDMTGAKADDVYVIWVKSDDNANITDDGVLFGEIYTEDGNISPVKPNPVVPGTPKDEKDNAKLDDVPKTSNTLPTLLIGLGMLALGTGAYTVRLATSKK